MCLLLVAVERVPGRPLLLLGNRDEFHERASAVAAPWADVPGVVGGRDLEAGGSWLAANRNGRFAAVTNIRLAAIRRGPRSRGDLVREFVAGDVPAAAYLRELSAHVNDYAPFNLVVADADGAWCFESPGARVNALTPGVHLVSNGPLDAPWPKMQRLRALFADAIARGADDAALLDLLRDRATPPDRELPDTGFGLERERFLSPIFVQSVLYGTRASTLAWRGGDGRIGLRERSYDAAGRITGDVVVD